MNIDNISPAFKFLISPSSGDSLKSDLGQISSCFLFLLLVCTGIVALGVFLEEADKWLHLLMADRPLLDMESGVFTPSPVFAVEKTLIHLGWILILLGIVGEGYFEAKISSTESIAQDFSNSLLLNAEALTGSAEKSAASAHGEADAAKASSKKAQNTADAVSKIADGLTRQLRDAESNLDKVETKRAALQRSLDDLEICSSPRVIPRSTVVGGNLGWKSTIDPLRHFARSVSIEFARNDAESRRAATSLRQALDAAGWRVLEFAEWDDIDDGVSVAAYMAPTDGTWTRDLWMDEIEAGNAADFVVDFLHSFDWQASRGWPLHNDAQIQNSPILPPKGLLIRVGLYPPVMYVTPPGMSFFNETKGQFEQEREKMEQEARAGLDKRRAERMKQMTPEQIAQYKDWIRKQDKEDELRKEREVGPCHPLNSLLPDSR